jgi:MFS family permease
MGDALAPAPRSSFRRFWAAATISSIGSAITAVAMPVLVVQLLGATPFEVGIVNAAQFLPYAVLGLIAGVYVDRWRRKPVLVWALSIPHTALRHVTIVAIKAQHCA